MADVLRLPRLDRFRRRVAGFRYIRGRVVEGPAGFVGALFVSGTGLTDGVVPAVVPTDAGLPIDQSPCAVRRTNGLSGRAVRFKRNEELAHSVAFADFPFADEVRASRKHGLQARFFELDSVDCSTDLLAVPVFVNNARGIFKVDTRDFSGCQGLTMSVFVNDHDGTMIVGGVGFRGGHGEGKKWDYASNNYLMNTHDSLSIRRSINQTHPENDTPHRAEEFPTFDFCFTVGPEILAVADVSPTPRAEHALNMPEGRRAMPLPWLILSGTQAPLRRGHRA